ncbi:MAG: HAMP domain-containing histidine kinase [Calditrichaeota bacterium]|nr:HAMP domain-containing histidine kinase [Calditrichota bacterium]
MTENPDQSTDMSLPSSQEIARLLPGFLHNLNNPLCTILNSVAFLQDDIGDETRGQRTVGELQRTTESVLQMVAGMQLFVRDVTNAASKLSVNKLLGQAIQLVRPLYHKQGGRINAEIEDSFGNLASPQTAHFLRMMTLLLMNMLEIMTSPPTLVLQTRRDFSELGTAFSCSLSCASRFEPSEIQPHFLRCEMFCQKLGGGLVIRDGEAGHLQFEIRIPLPTGGVFLD